MANRIFFSIAGSIALAIDHVKIGTPRMLEYVNAESVKVKAEQYIRIGNAILVIDEDVTLTWADLDTGSEENGKDYFVYACLPEAGNKPVFKISKNATCPAGYNPDNSRKIGGFHNNPDGDILQYSVWDLDFRPACPDPRGMVYDPKSNIWVDIYLASDDGNGGVKSEYGATILDSMNWFDFVDRGKKVGKRLLRYDEFMSIAEGTPEEVNIAGSSDPVTTGGHTATNGARIKSNIGVEDAAGVMWQWGLGNTYRSDGTDWGWYNLPGSKGSMYRQGSYGCVIPLFGGPWGYGSFCGSRCVNLNNYPWNLNSLFGARFACDLIDQTVKIKVLAAVTKKSGP